MDIRMSLTKKQLECYQAIKTYSMQHGEGPALHDLLPMINVKSKSGVHRLLNGLEERGWIARLPGRARSITLLGESVGPGTDLTSQSLRASLIAAGWTPPQN